MSWVTLTEAVEILSEELGYDKFIERSELEKTSNLKLTTSGESATLTKSGTGNLQDIIQADGYLLIALVKYVIKAVSETSVEIDTAINLTEETSFLYVEKNDTSAWELFYKRKDQALVSAYKSISPYVQDFGNDIPDSVKEAQSKLAAFYYSNIKYLPNGKDKSRIQSERIGDISTNYDTTKAQEKLPTFIIDILGNYYRSPFDPVFFQR